MGDPIARVQNPYPKNIVEFVKNLPKEEMSNDSFRQYMEKCKWGAKAFLTSYYQICCQVGLYYIDDNDTYHPRFTRDITENEATSYLENWFSKYYVPNPYTKGFQLLQKPILVEYSIYEYLKKNTDNSIESVCEELFKEPIGNPDIFINAINTYSKIIKVENKHCFIKEGAKKMEVTNSRDDKKAFFENFDSENNTNEKIDKAFNRIIFGAPGTGKSHKLEEESAVFINQEIVKTDISTQIKNEVNSAKDKKNFKSLYNAIGIKYAKDLPDNYKDIEATYGNNTYEIYVGVKASKVIQIFESKKKQYESDESKSIYDNIKQELDNITSGIEQNVNALGFVFGSYLCDFSATEITQKFDLNPKESKGYWLLKGAQAFLCLDEKKQQKEIKYLERVTFHPNYSYAQFVGTYKPVKSILNPEDITYEYVPGPFMRIYVNAKNNPKKNFLLLIEEINRANVAAVFGDIFQLLDRKRKGTSEYPITASEDQKRYLENNGINETEISLPSNMYIWATMNSADQGVFPMDTAFKRRWEFEYIGIDENEDQLVNDKKERLFIPVCKDGKVSQKVIWNDLRKAINNKLISLGINEDKLLGPFFLSKYALESAMDNGIDFVKLFESKVLMYLFEDAAKMKVRSLFNVDKYIYSEVCKKFENEGLDVFIFNDEDKVEPVEIENKNKQQTTFENGSLF